VQNLSSNAGIKYYGMVVTISGFLKVCFVLGFSILSYVISVRSYHSGGQTSPINDGFENNKEFASNHGTAIW
jgi:hypothetical protein